MENRKYRKNLNFLTSTKIDTMQTRTPPRKRAIFTGMWLLLALMAADQSAYSHEPAPVYSAQPQVIYEYPAHSGYSARSYGGDRLYGLRNFKPPGDEIYEPPPYYHPRGFHGGPYWGYYGYGYIAPGVYWGGFYPFGGYYGGY